MSRICSCFVTGVPQILKELNSVPRYTKGWEPLIYCQVNNEVDILYKSLSMQRLRVWRIHEVHDKHAPLSVFPLHKQVSKEMGPFNRYISSENGEVLTKQV